jgi:Lrp/AsnC family leucine-responsive transcriptional regulator
MCNIVDNYSNNSRNNRPMDEVDLQIIRMLQENARVSNTEIARQVGMVPSGVLDRIRRLEERGLIEGYRAKVDPKQVGLGLLAFIFVVTDEPIGQASSADELAAIPEVLEVHHIAGEDCYVAKIRVADTDALSKLIKEQLGAISSIKSTRTTIALETIKETARLPI